MYVTNLSRLFSEFTFLAQQRRDQLGGSQGLPHMDAGGRSGIPGGT